MMALAMIVHDNMGAGQSQEQSGASQDSPKVVRIERAEIPEEYKAVGVSHEVVNRVLGMHDDDTSSEVVRIERAEIPEEYKAVGVSHEVVNRVLGMHDDDTSSEVDSLREQLNRERAANEHLREQMRYLTDLQQRTPAYVPSEGSGSNISLEEMEERKRVFNETIDRVEQLFFGYQKENACQSNEEEIMECLNKNKTRLLNCSPLVNSYENCVAEMRAHILAEVGSA
ncbi:hypothetical protein Tcan_17411 [Toxocara canis]|uniref:MICOS complex subunit MIC19 n=1 Tax=Toxocara canis TaxID=6265 RepID=A0A0B2W1S4_TOXCA|nr:hypothetical protein Tcan_17411 [Toxocara canis]